MKAKFRKQHPDIRNVEMFMYTNEDQKHIIQVLGDEKSLGVAELTDGMYNAVNQRFSSNQKDIRDDDPIINQK